MDVIQSRIERGELTFNATLADALAGYGFVFAPNRKTAVADLMRFTDAESGNAFTADNPKLYGELDALFNQSLPLYAFRKNRTKDAKANARQFKMEKRADAVLRSPLRMFYGIEETAQPRAAVFNPEMHAAVVDGERKCKENQEIVDGVVSKLTPSITQAVRDVRKGRSDKGGNHKRREYKNGWRIQEDVAADFNKAKFAPEKGEKQKGGCTLSKIKQWDARYPDATHAHPHCGYHAMLRANPDLKSAYYEAVGAWRDYWAGWRVAFMEWRKAHKASPITAFRYNPVKVVSGYSPDLIGTDANGNQYGTPDGKPKKRKP